MKLNRSSDKDSDVPMIKQRMALLKESIQKFSAAKNLHQLCKEIVLSNTRALGFDRCGCFLYDAPNHQKLGAWGVAPDGTLCDEKGTTAPVYDHELRRSPNNSGVVMFYNKMLHHQDQAIGRGTLLQCNIYDGDELLGWLFIDNYLSKRDFTSNDIEFIELFGSVVGQLIVRQKHKEELVKNNLDLNDALSQMERMQKEIVEQKKNSALGHLVTGVAHELNTPIGVSVTGVSHMSSLIDDLIRATNPCTLTKSQIDKYLNELKETAELCQRSLARSSQLIQEFKQLQPGDYFRHASDVDLPAFLEDRFNYISYQYPDQTVALSIELEQCDQSYLLPEIPLTKVIDEVLLNAFQHAFQSTVNPRICIKISSLDESDPKKLGISISDNGAGMAEENLEKLFEPFYTSNRSQGAGLGASILYHTVKNQLHGDISVHRRLDRGLRFFLSIPVSSAA